MSDAEYAVQVDQWLKDRPPDVQPSTGGMAVSAYVIDDRVGTLSKAWHDREVLLAQHDLRLTPGQMKWLQDRAPKCPIKCDHTDLLVKPSASAGFDDDELRTYIVHELSKMPALAQVYNGITKFCVKDISRPCIKCPYTRELIPIGRALVPPYNEINRELKDTCGKAAASAFAKFIKDSVPTADNAFRGDLERLCTKHNLGGDFERLCTKHNLTPDMFVDRARTITVADKIEHLQRQVPDARHKLQRYIRTQDAKIKDLQRQLQEFKKPKGKKPEEVIVMSSNDEHRESISAAVPKAKRRRVSYPWWLKVGQIVEYTGDGYRGTRPLKKRLCEIIQADRYTITFQYLSDGARLHTAKRLATSYVRLARRNDQAGPAL